MKQILKDSFDEGRNTDIEWRKSESYKIDKRISGSDLGNRKIVQMTSDGNILNVFKNFKHARHFYENVLHRNKRCNGQNLKIAILGQTKSGGYYWAALSEDAKNGSTYNENQVDHIMSIDKKGKITKYSSTTDLADDIGKTRTQVYDILKKKDYTPVNGVIILYSNDYNLGRNYTKAFDTVAKIPRNKWFECVDTIDNTTELFKTARAAGNHMGYAGGVMITSGKYKDKLLKKRYRVNIVYRSDV